VWFTGLLPVNVFRSVIVCSVVVPWLLFVLKKASFNSFLKCTIYGKSESRILPDHFMMSARGIATEITRTLVDTQLVSSPQQCTHEHSAILQEVPPRKQNSIGFSHPRALISL